MLTSAETLVLLQGLPRRRQPFGTIKDIANAKYSQKKNIAKMRDPPTPKKKTALQCFAAVLSYSFFFTNVHLYI